MDEKKEIIADLRKSDLDALSNELEDIFEAYRYLDSILEENDEFGNVVYESNFTYLKELYDINKTMYNNVVYDNDPIINYIYSDIEIKQKLSIEICKVKNILLATIPHSDLEKIYKYEINKIDSGVSKLYRILNREKSLFEKQVAEISEKLTAAENKINYIKNNKESGISDDAIRKELRVVMEMIDELEDSVDDF